MFRTPQASAKIDPAASRFALWHTSPQKPLSGDLTLIQIRFPIIKELSPFYLWLRAVDGINITSGDNYVNTAGDN